jgi:hypothetical protein
MTDTTDNGRAEFTRRRNAGLRARHAKRLARWEGIDSWLTRWEAAQDPDGRYGRVGADPARVISKLGDVA